jgi:hypothetical protein
MHHRKRRHHQFHQLVLVIIESIIVALQGLLFLKLTALAVMISRGKLAN